MRHVLVTGGLGFIGSHLVSELLNEPDTIVHAVDNLLNNALEVEQIVSEVATGKPGRLEVNVQSIEQYEPDVPFDRIYHLASVVGPAGVLDHAGFITESIVSNTYRMMRLARDCGARLVHVSTSEIYGGGVNGYCDERTPRIVKPLASARLEYAAGKLAAEVALENLCKRGELDAVTIRPFNVSGVRQLGIGGFVLPRFVGQALLGVPLTVFGNGTQVRAFTDVRDIVSGLMVVAGRGTSGTAYNVGNPANRVTIHELARRVVEVTGTTSEIAYVDPKSIYGPAYEEAEDKFPNAERVMSLGWQPRYRLEDTIRAVYEWMRAMPVEMMSEVAGVSPCLESDYPIASGRHRLRETA